MKTRLFCYILCGVFATLVTRPLHAADPFVNHSQTGFVWIAQHTAGAILAEKSEDPGVLRAINTLRQDAFNVTGVTVPLWDLDYEDHALLPSAGNRSILLIGTLEHNGWIKELAAAGRLDAKQLEGCREKYILTTIEKPFEGIDRAIVIAGSDKRGAIYGIYELSTQMGVSPWYYWADVPPRKSDCVAVTPGTYTDGEPAVRFRGIFLNDEWPALGNWAKDTFGDYNSKFYEKVFELVLRLKGNFMWPAMWNSAFYDDDPLNGPLANEMGIVMGTSHHEPMGQAQQDWKRRGTGEWNYTTNKKVLQEFWQEGMERCKDWEAVITLAMRGDGDMAMSASTNTKLLQQIVEDQRKIITKVTGKKASETPQVWALYKEVQDYYDQGMRVPDDVTLLLCDDNWGNVRRLPSLDAQPRSGGYGMYYHFDYVGAPRNSKWANITQIQRTWEQMTLCYDYGVRELWVVNVGDLKPMEYPIDFFLDLAWDPHRFTADNLWNHTVEFCKESFGDKYAEQIAEMINTYTRYNRRITPELLNDRTYSLTNYDEWNKVMNEYQDLELEALQVNYLLPQEVRDAYDQLVLYPIQAMANLYRMYYAVAQNKALAAVNDPAANIWADKVNECFDRDSVLTWHYNHEIAGGKWNHIMDQVHIGYYYWNDPPHNIRPQTVRVTDPATTVTQAEKVFYPVEGAIGIEAAHFNRSRQGASVTWIEIPNLGRTVSSMTTWPCTSNPEDNMWLEYDFVTEGATTDSVIVHARFSTTLNFNDYKGLRYAVSIDGGPEQIININGDYRGELGKWQADHVITCVTRHLAEKERRVHTLRYRALDPALVLQRFILDCGGLKQSFFGPPERIGK